MQAVQDFVFDLHDSTRRALNAVEVTALYDHKFRELTEKYFASSSWPEASVVAADCNGDEGFLLLYREMTLRARSMVSGSFKFQASDFVDSWSNYQQLFEFVRGVDAQDLVLTPQWVYDIIQEYVYQFQGFCQLRTQSRNERDAALLLDNRNTWTAPAVHRALVDLVSMQSPSAPQVKLQFAYFAAVELARLECLLGDYSASIQSIGGIRLLDRGELVHMVPSAHISVFYHAGVSLLMLRRYPETIALLSEALLHISRVLRPGAATLRTQAQQLLQKTMEKVTTSSPACSRASLECRSCPF